MLLAIQMRWRHRKGVYMSKPARSTAMAIIILTSVVHSRSQQSAPQTPRAHAHAIEQHLSQNIETHKVIDARSFDPAHSSSKALLHLHSLGLAAKSTRVTEASWAPGSFPKPATSTSVHAQLGPNDIFRRTTKTQWASPPIHMMKPGSSSLMSPRRLAPLQPN